MSQLQHMLSIYESSVLVTVKKLGKFQTILNYQGT